MNTEKTMPVNHRLLSLVAALLFLSATNVPAVFGQTGLPAGDQLRHNGAVYNTEIGFTAPYVSAFGVDPKEEQIVRNQASRATIQLDSSNWPARRVVDFRQPMAQLQWLNREQKNVQLNMLIGNQINPAWFANGNWNRQQLDEHLEFWIRSVADVFGDDIDSVVVLNEAVWDPAATGGNTWNNSGSFGTWWGMGTDINGGPTPEYARRAFELARLHFPPNVKLIYNDYNHGSMNGKANAIYEFVRHLAQSPITKPDVIGFQAHYHIRADNQVWALDQGPSTPLQDMAGWARNVDRYTALGIESHVTELDMQIPANNSRWRREQAKQFGRIADFVARRADITVMTFWVNYDGNDPDWLPQGNATLFASDGRPKEAFYGVQQGLLGILYDETYRISDDWTRKYVLVGSGNSGTYAVTHRSNPSWSAGKWTVRPDSNGTFRLESRQHRDRYLQANADGSVRLRPVSNSGSQLWRATPGSSSNRVRLANQDTGLFMNSTGTHDNAWLNIWFPNGLGNQNWLFDLE